MSNGTKLTAVDFLIKQKEKWGNIILDDLRIAKEMEKEQIGYTKADVIKAGEMGEINYLDTLHIVTYLDEAKQFNKTYGGNK